MFDNSIRKYLTVELTIKKNTIYRFCFFFIVIGILLTGCSVLHTDSINKGQTVYNYVSDILNQQEAAIDYADLMNVFNALTNSDTIVPDYDKIIGQLIKKRNDHQRIDQMILIFSAMLVGQVKHPIPGVQALIETMILDERLSVWGIGFIAGALADYHKNLQEGERLADLIEERLEALIKKEEEQPRERFGYHFLPPPEIEYVKNYISHFSSRKRRETARLYYYNLRLNYSEDDIRSGLVYIDHFGDLQAGNPVDYKMKYLVDNIDQIIEQSKKFQR